MWHIDELANSVVQKKKQLTEGQIGEGGSYYRNELMLFYLGKIAQSLANIADSLEEMNGYDLSANVNPTEQN